MAEPNVMRRDLKRKIADISVMAENICKMPGNKLSVANFIACTAQALRDIADVLEELNNGRAN